jgi:3-hydroxyisobutyrate dehydrogenase-like beta-hydroxyacid dehydrogenase
MGCAQSSASSAFDMSTNWNKDDLSIGFVGFGEAGFHIAKGLKSAGLSRIVAFDIDPGRVRSNAEESGTPLVGSNQDLADAARIILSVVTCARAKEAARQTAPFLTPHHIYADLNSVSPALKQEIEEVIGATGAGFVEAAVMSPVPPYGHCAPMLLGGRAAPAFAQLMTPFGMRLEVVSESVGTAAAAKMFRSIIVKGLEALMLECVLAATPYGADERVFSSLCESFPGIDWQRLADYMVSRVVIHGERRAREMEEVAETLESLGIEPIMAQAAARRQDWCARLGISDQFGSKGPKTYREALQAIRGQTSKSPNYDDQ